MGHSSSTPRWSAALVAACTVAPLFAGGLGCAPDKGPGTLVVSYVLGNNKTCAELGIESVRASMYIGDIDEEAEPAYTEAIACTDDGEIVLGELEPGIYTIHVTAADSAGVDVLDNLGQSAIERTSEIFEAAETSLEAELTARPAQVSLRWRLGPDGFGTCEGVGIANLEFTAYLPGGTTELLSHTFPCSEPGDANGYRKIPDPERVLYGDQLGEVGVQPLDAAGDPVGDSAVFLFPDPIGAGYPAELTIECLDTGCTPT